MPIEYFYSNIQHVSQNINSPSDRQSLAKLSGISVHSLVSPRQARAGLLALGGLAEVALALPLHRAEQVGRLLLELLQRLAPRRHRRQPQLLEDGLGWFIQGDTPQTYRAFPHKHQ